MINHSGFNSSTEWLLTPTSHRGVCHGLESLGLEILSRLWNLASAGKLCIILDILEYCI